ncbi:MAG: AAA family ATPase [Candidatus Omnitrophica bacterium]|nr:AAA family ATPase [Candidatus Omnitrophota bacterium]
MKELSIVLVGEDRHLGQLLAEIRKVKIVQTHVELVALDHAKESLTRIRPHLVIYGDNGDTDLLERAVHSHTQSFNEIPWAIASDGAEVERVLKFFRMGAVDFLRNPIETQEMKRLIGRVKELHERKNSNGKEEKRNLIGVFSTKGGVGLTTIATNLAVEVAKQKTGKVLLLDLVLQHGNVADFLDVSSQYTLIQVIENFERLDSNLLEHSLAKHELGFYVLPCPKEPEEGDFLTTKEITDILHFMKGTFNSIIADLGHEFSKATLSYLDLADLILLVCTPDVPSLYNAKSALTTLKRLGCHADKIKIILNRFQVKGGIESSLIQKTLANEISFKLPDDPVNALNAINVGKPVSVMTKNSELAKSIRDLASALLKPFPLEVLHVAQ